jgi:hypothetical protein
VKIDCAVGCLRMPPGATVRLELHLANLGEIDPQDSNPRGEPILRGENRSSSCRYLIRLHCRPVPHLCREVLRCRWYVKKRMMSKK